MRRMHRAAVLASALLLPLVAQAHPGHEAHAGLMQGLLHPLTGWDHLVVLLSLGALTAGRGRRVALICGAALVAALMGGAIAGMAWPTAPFVEAAIRVSAGACVLLLASRRHINRSSLSTLCIAFALVHGVAHGQEAPHGDLAGYFTGFIVSCAVLYVSGVLAAQRVLRRVRPAPLPQR